MYNRYIKSSADDESYDNYVPIMHNRETAEADEANEAEEIIESTEKSEPEQEVCSINTQVSESKEKKPFSLNGMLKGVNFDLDTIIVLALALFILCDNYEESKDTILLLALILLLGF